MNRKQRRASAKPAAGTGTATAINDTGIALARQGKLDEAIAAFRRAIGLKADYADAHSNLGLVLAMQGKREDAISAYRQAIRLQPHHADALYNLGSALAIHGKLDEAIAAFRQAIGIRPDHADAHANLGLALANQGKLEEAIAAYRQAIGINASHADACFNLGRALAAQGKFEEAVAAFRQAIRIRPNHAEAHGKLGNALAALGEAAAAIAAFRQAIVLDRNHAEAHCNLGMALAVQGQLGEAIAAYRQAIASQPNHLEAHSNLASALAIQGRTAEAIAAYRRAIAVNPNRAEVHSNLALCLGYSDQVSAAELFAAHRDWDRRFGHPTATPNAHANTRVFERRLKIGYVSPDFREHAVAFFLEPPLRQHDRQAFEVFCYADVARPDAVTARLQGCADHWSATSGLSDEALAERIREDSIDILVDLAGHTLYNRLKVFALKPAPIQVTWLGYPHSTGLDAMDYRLIDAVTDPAGEADGCASETLIRLEGGFLCYAGSGHAPEPAQPPCLATSAVTFGSFNNPAKLSDATLDVWARLLDRLPQARLLLKGLPYADDATRALFLSRLGERGVAAERIELMGWQASGAAHLALYDRVDIALDPFPYNGTTTTCEALWMGVPVVALCGDRHAARVSASLLTQVGLTDWIAGSTDAYVDIAAALAGDPAQLNHWRRSLRPRLASSPLCDGRAFARKIEAAYRTMWRQWCETGGHSLEPGVPVSG